MEELKPLKNVELHKDIQFVFTVTFRNDNPRDLSSWKEPNIYMINYIKDSDLVSIPLRQAIVTPDMTGYQENMNHFFEVILIWQKQITGIVKNDIMNIYYSREECLDDIGLDRFSVNGLNKITRSFMRKIYEYIRNDFIKQKELDKKNSICVDHF